MAANPTSPNGTPVSIRPITIEELDRVVLRCWPNRTALDRLFAAQTTIGLAAWDGTRCVAELHGYRVQLPDGEDEHWPPWTTYARIGFQPLAQEGQDELPTWAQGAAPPEVVAEAQTALVDRRIPSTFYERLMALDLRTHAKETRHV